jgi:hypothetical protein
MSLAEILLDVPTTEAHKANTKPQIRNERPFSLSYQLRENDIKIHIRLIARRNNEMKLEKR